MTLPCLRCPVPVAAVAAVAAALVGCERRPVAPELSPAHRFIEVAAGDSHTCAVTADAGTFCWGNVANGRLGHAGGSDVAGCDGRTCDTPVRLEEDLPFTVLATGEAHTCGIAWGRPYCWGQDRFGQLGDGGRLIYRCADYEPFLCSVQPVPAEVGYDFVAVTAARDHTCGLAADGRAYCWGWNLAGQLGTGTKDDEPHSLPSPVAGDLHFTAISTGTGHTCAVTADGAAYCWGSGVIGRLGTGTDRDSFTPAPVAGGHRYTSIVAAGEHTCGLAVDGTVYCWGWGNDGRLGAGNNGTRYAPQVTLMPEPAVAVSAAADHTCAIAGSGQLYCWGNNDAGQLGIGSWNDESSPRPVPLPGRVLEVTAGAKHTCAITQEERLFCWGSNRYGQVGDGTGIDRNTPVPVSP